MSSDKAINIQVLDAAYKPFPTFEEWLAKTKIDLSRWNKYTASLDSRRQGFSDEEFSHARKVATRAAAFDTGAIEGLYETDKGFTYSVAFETASWEAALDQKGENVRSLFEAQLHAYDYVLDLATKAQPISEIAIRTLHEVVCAAQQTYRVITPIGPQEQPLPKGVYKSLPNHVRTRRGEDHSYAPVDVTPAEMYRLVNELRTERFQNAHPIIQSAYIHYAFVVIHPFADGNGRVSRALASAFTYRAIRMPVVILSEHRDPYITALEEADRGDFQPFQDFILVRCLDTLNLVEASLRNARTPAVKENLAAIDALYFTRGGYTHEQVDAAGIRLVEAAEAALRNELSTLPGGKVVGLLNRIGQTQHAPPAGFRLPGSGRAFVIQLATASPIAVTVSRNYSLIVPKDAVGDDDVKLLNNDDSFVARMDELTPVLAGVLQLRLNMFAERVFGELVDQLRVLADRARKDRV